MTNKIYKTAQGKTVDLGALILQNEKVRAVGNMNVNARGDILDSANKVIEPKNRQVQQQYRRNSNVSADRAVSSSNPKAKKIAKDDAITKQTSQVRDNILEPTDNEIVAQEAQVDLSQIEPVTAPPRQVIPQGGLAGAIARSKLIKQEKEKTLRERQREAGLKKI